MTNVYLEAILAYIPSKYRRWALPSLGALIAIAVIALVIYTFTQNVIDKRNQAVSQAYWQFTSAIEEDEIETAKNLLAEIKDTGTDEQYVIPAMLLAAHYFANKEYDQAESLYLEIIEKAQHYSIQDTAKVRLAKVWTNIERFDDARSLLLEIRIRNPQFDALIADLLGDISLAEGNLDEAEQQYTEAYDILVSENMESFSGLIQIKLAMIVSNRLRDNTSLAADDVQVQVQPVGDGQTQPEQPVQFVIEPVGETQQSQSEEPVQLLIQPVDETQQQEQAEQPVQFVIEPVNEAPQSQSEEPVQLLIQPVDETQQQEQAEQPVQFVIEPVNEAPQSQSEEPVQLLIQPVDETQQQEQPEQPIQFVIEPVGEAQQSQSEEPVQLLIQPVDETQQQEQAEQPVQLIIQPTENQ